MVAGGVRRRTSASTSTSFLTPCQKRLGSTTAKRGKDAVLWQGKADQRMGGEVQKSRRNGGNK